MFPISLSVLEAIGLLTLSLLLVKVFNLIGIYTRPSRLARFAHPSQHGDSPWALVTGASDGIGRAYAHELAASGFNVVLHGRNHAKLSNVVGQLSVEHPQRRFKILVADASAVPCGPCLAAPLAGGETVTRALDFDNIQRELEGLNLTVLINNAGGAPVDPVCQPIVDSTAQRLAENISLNALFPLQLTRALLPTLIKNSPSLVINTSTMIDSGFPLLASYSASKQFLMAMTNALRLEMEIEGKGNDVEILGIKVGRVTGARGHTLPVSFFVPDATMMAQAALARAGHGNKIVPGYWPHALQQLACEVLELLPARVRDSIYIDQMLQERAASDKENVKTPKVGIANNTATMLQTQSVGEVLHRHGRRLSIVHLEMAH